MNDKGASYSGFDGDVGPGWIPILDGLADRLVALGWDRDLRQVKEKFGGLRFYIGQATPEMHNEIKKAETMAWKTCEICGKAAKPRRSGWLKTLCDDHAQLRESRK